MIFHKRLLAFWIVLFLICTFLFSCTSKEGKRDKFYKKGVVFYNNDDYSRARIEFKNALQIDGEYAEAYNMLGNVYLKQKNYKQAYASFNKAVSLSPEISNAQIQMGKLLLASKMPDKALEKAEIVLKNDAENVEALVLKAAVLLVRKDFSNAKSILNNLFSKEPEEPEVYRLLALIYLSEKDITGAESALKKGIEKNPSAISLYSILSGIYLHEKKYNQVETVLKDIVNIEPTNKNRLKLASFYKSINDQAKTDAILKEIINKNEEGEPDGRLIVSNFYLSQKNINKAVEILEEGLRLNPENFEIRLQLSRLYTKIKKESAALSLLEKGLLLEKDPGAPDIIKSKTMLAEIYISQMDIEKAQTYVDDVLKEDPKNIDATFVSGKIFLLEGNGSSAVASFRTVVNEKPEFIPGHIYLAQAHLLSNERQLAMDTLKKALDAHPSSPELLNATARLYMADKKFEEAEKMLKKIIEYNPDDARSYIILGEFYTAMKAYDKANGIFNEIIKKQPQNPLGYIKVSQNYARLGDIKKSIETLEKGNEIITDNVLILSTLVKLLIQDKQFDRAKEISNGLVQKYPENAVGYNFLGGVETYLKNYESAEKAYMKAIEISPMGAAQNNGLARLYVIQGKKEEAVKKLSESVKSNPQNNAAWFSLGLLYEQAGEYQKAISTYEEALSLNPKLWSVANNLSYLIVEHSQSEEDLQKALELSKKIVRAKPNTPEFLDTLGWVYVKMEKYNKAIGIFEKALEHQKENPVFNYHMGIARYKNGNISESRENFEIAAASDTDFEGKEKSKEILKEIELKE